MDFVQNINESYENLLREYLPKDLFTSEKIKILSMACGQFREAETLLNCFSTNNVFLCGIDVDEILINKARNRLDKKNVFIKCADATNIENYQDWTSDGLFNLIIFRHPEITFNTDVFMRLFSLAKNLILPNGYILITTHFHNEKEAIKTLFKMLKYEILLDIENPSPVSCTIDNEMRYVDKFLLIGKCGNTK